MSQPSPKVIAEDNDLKERVRVFWQTHPCGTKFSDAEMGTPEFFERVEAHRYTKEWHIPEAADFAGARGSSILEIGCGMGTHAAMLARNGARLTAIDLTEKAVETTKCRFQMFGLEGDIRRADAERLAFADHSFDFVWSWGVIHHSSSTEAIVAEITRVLRPGGKLMIMVYYKPSLVYYVHVGLIRGVLLGKLLRHSVQDIYTAASDGFYARVFTKKELRAVIGPEYTNIRTTVVGLKPELYPIPRTYLKEQVERFTPDWLASAILSWCGSMIVVEAEKS